MKQNPDFLAGMVFEMDETTYVNTKNDEDDNDSSIGRRGKGKAMITGIKVKGYVKAKVIQSVSFESLINFVKESLQEGSELYTDECKSYSKFKNVFNYKTVYHKENM